MKHLADSIPTMARARRAVARLTKPTIEEIMDPVLQCEKRLREGVATEDQVLVLLTYVRIALGIEKQGIVRGLHNHIQPGLVALEAVHTRANTTGQWVPTALYFHELDAVRTALEMHGHQLQHLSRREYHQVVRTLIMRTRSTGETATYVQGPAIGLQARGAAA